jgi:hypothetical protein
MNVIYRNLIFIKAFFHYPKKKRYFKSYGISRLDYSKWHSKVGKIK